MLTYFVIIPILIATFLYLFSSAKIGKVLAIIVQSLLVMFAFYLFYLTRSGDVTTNIGNFRDVLGITLRADNLSAVFILLTAFIFLIAAVFSYRERLSRLFWLLLFIWEASLIGIFLTRDMFNVFVLLEVANVVVCIMIMYLRRSRSMYDGLIYLMSNLVAVQFYLFGIGYIYRMTGVFDMDSAAQVITRFPASQFFLPYALIMTGIAFKCALLPLYSWLPKAHGTPGAPSAVSAILSGLHIKTGLYLFIRFQSVFGEISVSEFYLAVGIITGIGGVVLALAQKDIKLILAYSTIAQIGLIMIGLGLDGTYSYVGSLYHIINHAVFKAALFLSAGIIAHAYHTRDTTKICAVFRRMPVVGVAIILAILGISGAPLFNGSISKYFIMSEVSPLLFWIINLINLGTITVCIKFSMMLFGPLKHKNDCIKVYRSQEAAVFTLGTACFILGVFGVPIVRYLFGVHVSVDVFGYLEKVLVFVVSLGLGYFIYQRHIKEGNRFLERVRTIDIGFRGMCIFLGAFFGATLLAVSFLNNL